MPGPSEEHIRRELNEIASKRQRGAALQEEALRLFDESDEQARKLALAQLSLASDTRRTD